MVSVIKILTNSLPLDKQFREKTRNLQGFKYVNTLNIKTVCFEMPKQLRILKCLYCFNELKMELGNVLKYITFEKLGKKKKNSECEHMFHLFFLIGIVKGK